MFVAYVSIGAGGLGSAYSKRFESFKITPFFHFQSWWFRIITFHCSWSDLYPSAVLQLQSSNLELSPRGINALQWLQITSHAVKRAMWLTLLKTPTFGKDLHLNPRHAESQADTNYKTYYFVHLNVKGISQAFCSIIQLNVSESVKSHSASLLQQVLVKKKKKKPRKLVEIFWHKSQTLPLL